MTREISPRVSRSEPCIGTWLSIGSPIIAELAALSGFDWLLFDLEHGAATDAALLANLQAIRGTPVMPIVRVGAPHPDLILRALDWGSAGIMVPHIETVAQAQDCLQAIHYPPRGRRGFSRSVRAHDYGLRKADELPLPRFYAQIESLCGIENVEAIAAIDGVDVLFVGPADLGHDLSQQRNGQTPSFDECLARVVAGAIRAGKQAGILVRNLDDLAGLRTLGFTQIAVDSDIAILRQRYQHLCEQARSVRGVIGLPRSPHVA